MDCVKVIDVRLSVCLCEFFLWYLEFWKSETQIMQMLTVWQWHSACRANCYPAPPKQSGMCSAIRPPV